MVVLKYGGTSVACCPETMAQHVKRHVAEGVRPVVVVSALAGVTDLLILPETPEARGTFLGIHRRWIKQAQLPPEVMRGIEHLPWHPSVGEKAASILVAQYFGRQGIPAKEIWADEDRVVLSSRERVVRVQLRAVQNCLDRNFVPVVTGFVSFDVHSQTTACLGRSGSDVTAAALADALSVPAYIYTDVDGIMSADPGICDNARTIPVLSRQEAMEMACSGARVLHPHTLMHDTELIVANTFDEMAPTTRILRKDEAAAAPPVQSILCVDRCCMLDIGTAGRFGVPGTMADIFSRLTDINVRFVAQTCAETLISTVVDDAFADAALAALAPVYDVAARDVAVITVIGDGLRRRVGIASQIFQRIAGIGVNVEGIGQGSSERSMSIVVARDHASDVVRALHRLVESGGRFTS